MKNCSFCGAENEDAAAFCEECGKSFYKKCDKCGAENKLSAKFCNKCGEKFIAQNTICYTATKKVISTWIDENSLSHDFDDGNGYIVLKDGVDSIDGEIFKDCIGLTSLTIPDSVNEIKIPYWKTEEYKKLLPSDVWDKLKEYLEPNTMYYEADEELISPWLVRSRRFRFNFDCNEDAIISHEFVNGKGAILLKNGVNEIGEKAFSGCSGLTSINIPDSVTEIDYGAFEGCSGLTSINIPDSVTKIGGWAFRGCSGLTSINIPDSVTEIGGWAFEGCSGLTSINIPDSVTGIGYSAFSGCSGLTTIIIPDSVTGIGKSAFYGCSGLSGTLTIPNSVTSIGGYAFSGCSGLTSIVVAKGNGKYDSRNNCNAIIETATNTLVTGCMNTVIPDSVTEIDYGAFEGCSGLTSINIPDSVTKIGGWAFRGCSGLTSINIPDSVTEIGGRAFRGCSGLTSINIPDSVTEIGESAFDGCSAPTAINISKKVKKIGECAFDGCRNIMYNGKAKGKPWGALTVNGHVDGYLVYADESKSVLTGCSTLATEAVIPDSVTGIGEYAFSGCLGLTSINIPDSLAVIGYKAFEDCSGLTSIVVAKGNGKYDSRNNCNAIIETATNTLVVGCMNTVIPDSVTGIGPNAFYGCSGLTSINIPDLVTEIGGWAFSGCSSLTSINLPDSVTEIYTAAFEGCSGLTSINIPDSVTEIGKYAFEGCCELKLVTISNSVTKIGRSAFYDCNKLPKVIKNKIKEIEVMAFEDPSFIFDKEDEDNYCEEESSSYYDATYDPNDAFSAVNEAFEGDPSFGWNID